MVTLPIKTERLYLRRYLPEDGETLFSMLCEETVRRFTPYPTLSFEETMEEAAERAKSPDFIAVCLSPSERMIGSIYLTSCGFDGAELAFLFHRDFWHRGYAMESCRAVLDAAFSSGLHRVSAVCDAENDASVRLLERLGMKREGFFRKNLYYHTDETGNPLWRDTFFYAVLCDEWKTE